MSSRPPGPPPVACPLRGPLTTPTRPETSKAPPRACLRSPKETVVAGRGGTSAVEGPKNTRVPSPETQCPRRVLPVPPDPEGRPLIPRRWTRGGSGRVRGRLPGPRPLGRPNYPPRLSRVWPLLPESERKRSLNRPSLVGCEEVGRGDPSPPPEGWIPEGDSRTPEESPYRSDRGPLLKEEGVGDPTGRRPESRVHPGTLLQQYIT